MTTIQKSSRKSCWCLRTISRRRRRTRLRTTAPPRRPLVIKPARDAPEFCTARVARTMNLPRSAWPASFTRSKSEVRVKRRVFGKENKRASRTSIIDLAIHNRTGGFCRTAKVFPRKRSREDCLQANDEPDYGEGDGFTLMFVSVLVSVLDSGAGGSFMIVVLVSLFSAGGFVTVVSLCSQPPRSAAPARMIIYFFIMLELTGKRLRSW